MNVGIDFGSTYTVVSIYDKNSQKVAAYQVTEGADASIPSVVTLRNSRYKYGSVAKKQTGAKGTLVFRGFKMLLSSDDPGEWEKRGFSGDNTPEHITGLFLKFILDKLLADFHETKIENLVIGVPEIWQKGLNTIDGRTKIRDICRSIDYVEKAQAVSEPAAASAYFAYNYFRTTGKTYAGHILLVDYGGGTLDVTLTDVRSAKEDSSVMEIRIEDETGAGENKDGRIGQAGIAYMEEVTAEAILEAAGAEGLPAEKGSLVKEPGFPEAVNSFENALMTQMDEIEEAFGTTMDEGDLDELYEEGFCTLPFQYMDPEGTKHFLDVKIPYSVMLHVYNDVIYDVLHEQLGKIMEHMEANHIDYSDPDAPDFKIVLVGGFSNYYLVGRQVQEELHFSAFEDSRDRGFALTRTDREQAVSLGAALLANGVIRLRNTAPFTIGIGVMRGGKPAVICAFHHREDIVFNKVYDTCDAKGQSYLYMVETISSLYVGWGYNSGKNYRLKEEFRRKIGVELNKSGISGSGEIPFVKIGFSLDNSEVLSMHFQRYDVFCEEDIGKPLTIELTKMKQLIEE